MRTGRGSLALGHSNPLVLPPPCAGVDDAMMGVHVPLVRLLCFAARGRMYAWAWAPKGDGTTVFVPAPSLHEHDASPQNRFLERWMLPLPRHSQPRDRQLRVAMDHNPNIFIHNSI